MFNFFRKRRIKKYIEEASKYLQKKYIEPVKPKETRSDKSTATTPIRLDEIRFSISRPPDSDVEDKVRYSDRGADVHYSEKEEKDTPSADIKYSLKEKPSEDHYNASAVSDVLRNYSTATNYNEMLKTLEKSVNQTFVNRLLYYINTKGVRDSEVYKAAQVDKRLFSKIISDHEYKPSKDTAIALALALELSLEEVNDLLSRAGYTFSHSNKRDIIIEFFFREKVYNLIDVNEVLYSLNQKLIGRF